MQGQFPFRVEAHPAALDATSVPFDAHRMISWSPLLSCSLLQLLRRFGVNLAVLQQMLVREELLSTAIHRADVALMQGQFILRVEAHRTALDAARVPFDTHWIISWSPLLSCGFLQLLHRFGSGYVLTSVTIVTKNENIAIIWPMCTDLSTKVKK